MKKMTLLSSALVLILTVAFASGCEQKSQMEKDADKAAKKIEGVMK